MTTPTDGQIVLRQKASNIVAFPVFFAVVLLAIVIRQFFPSPNPIVLAVCGALAVLDGFFARYLLRHTGATMVVTLDEIAFRRKGAAAPLVIRRTAGGTLSLVTESNGPVGSKYTSYTLKLHDDATGDEVPADIFGRRRVKEACEALAWTFG